MNNTSQGFWSRLWYGAPKDNGENPQSFSNDMPAAIAPPSRSIADMSITGALSLPTLYRSVQIISTVGSSLEIGVFRDGERIPTPLIALQPDPDRSRTDFLKRTIVNLATTGNAFWHVTRDSKGRAQFIRSLAPSAVSVYYSRDGREKLYDYSGSDGKTVTYTGKEIQHLRLFELDGHLLGLGPIQACRAELQGAKALRDYASNWTQAPGGVPTGVLSTEQEIDRGLREAYAESWYDMVDDGGVAVLGKGLKYTPVSYSPEDIQWLESQKWNSQTISNLMGLPANYTLSDEGESSFTYTNNNSINQLFYQNTLQAYLNVMEAAFSLILVKGQTAKFLPDNLLKTDESAKYQNYAVAIQSGWLTPDEVREKEGLSPLPKPAPAPTPVVEPDFVDPETDPEL